MWILLAVKTLQFNSLLHCIFRNIYQVLAMLVYWFLGIHCISLYICKDKIILLHFKTSVYLLLLYCLRWLYIIFHKRQRNKFCAGKLNF